MYYYCCSYYYYYCCCYYYYYNYCYYKNAFVAGLHCGALSAPRPPSWVTGPVR